MNPPIRMATTVAMPININLQSAMFILQFAIVLPLCWSNPHALSRPALRSPEIPPPPPGSHPLPHTSCRYGPPVVDRETVLRYHRMTAPAPRRISAGPARTARLCPPDHE